MENFTCLWSLLGLRPLRRARRISPKFRLMTCLRFLITLFSRFLTLFCLPRVRLYPLLILVALDLRFLLLLTLGHLAIFLRSCRTSRPFARSRPTPSQGWVINLSLPLAWALLNLKPPGGF